MLEPDANVSPWDVGVNEKHRRIEAERVAFNDTVTAHQKVGSALEENSMTSWLMAQSKTPTFEADPEFKITKEMLTAKTEGIDDSYRHELFAAKSEAELDHIVQTIKHSQENMERIFAGGMMSGLGYSVAGALIDPLGMAVGGAAGKLPAMFMKNYRTMNQARLAGAAAGAAGTSAVEGYIASQSPTVGIEDVIWSAAFGGAIGSFTHGLSKADAEQIKASHAKIRDSLDDKTNPDNRPSQSFEDESDYWHKREGESIETALKRSATASGRADEKVFGASNNWLVQQVSKVFRSRRVQVEGDDDYVLRELMVLTAGTSTGYRQATDEIGLLTRRDFHTDRVNLRNVQAFEEANQALSEHLGRAATREEINGVMFDILSGRDNALSQVPGLASAGAKYRKILDDLNAEELDAGLGQASREDYYPHRWLAEKIGKNMAAFERLVVQGLGDKVPKDVAKRIGKHMTNAITKVKSGRQSDLLDVLNGDTSRLDDLLTYGDVTDEQREAILEFAAVLNREAKSKAEGPTFRRKRLEFDLDAVDADSGLTLKDFLDLDVSSVVANRYMKGKGRVLLSRLGFKTESDFMTFLESRLAGKDPRIAGEQRAVFETIYDTLVGRPSRHSQTGPFAEAVEAVMKLQTSIYMNNMGLSSAAEFGHVMATVSMRNLAKASPGFRDFVASLKAGKLPSADAAVLESIVGGFGKSRLMRDLMRSIDAETQGTVGAAGQVSQKLANITMDISGHSAVVTMQHMMYASGTIYDWMRFAKHGDRPNHLSAARLRDFGLSETDVTAIQAAIKKHSKGDSIADFGFDQWDANLRDKFSMYLYASGRKYILEPNIADKPRAADGLLYRCVFQFMTHVMTSFDQNLMRNLKHRDATAARMAMMSMFFGGLTYMGLVNMRSIGRDDREHYLDENLTWDKIGAAAFQRSSMASLVPNAVDTALWAADADPMFSYRSSELGTAFISGSPLIRAAEESIPNTVRTGIGLLRGEEPHSQDIAAFRRLVPFQNAFIIQNFWNNYQQSAPYDRSLK